MNKNFLIGLGLGYLFTKRARRNSALGTFIFPEEEKEAIPWEEVKQGIIEEINKGGNGKKYLESLKGETIKLPTSGEYTFYPRVLIGKYKKGEKRVARQGEEEIHTWKIGNISNQLYVQKGKKNEPKTSAISKALIDIANEESAIPWAEVKRGIIADIDNGGSGEKYLESRGVKGRVIQLPTSRKYKFYRLAHKYKKGEKRWYDKSTRNEDRIYTWTIGSIKVSLYVLEEKTTQEKIRQIGRTLIDIANEESIIPWPEVKQGIIANIEANIDIKRGRGGRWSDQISGAEYLESKRGRVIQLPRSRKYKFYSIMSVRKGGKVERLPGDEITTWTIGSLKNELFVQRGKNEPKRRLRIITALMSAVKGEL